MATDNRSVFLSLLLFAASLSSAFVSHEKHPLRLLRPPTQEAPKEKPAVAVAALSAGDVALTIPEPVKNGLVGVWLFGGLVPALVGVNAFAVRKAFEPVPDDFVRVDPRRRAKSETLKFASLGAPDDVLADDVADVLGRARTADDIPGFEPLTQALGGISQPGASTTTTTKTTTTSDELLYLSKPNFKRWARRSGAGASLVGDAALDGLFDAFARGSGVAAKRDVDSALRSWRTEDGALDLGAVDVAIGLGRAAILFGFLGLLLIDLVALFGLAFAITSSSATVSS